VALAAHAGHVYRLRMNWLRAAELTAQARVDRNEGLLELALTSPCRGDFLSPKGCDDARLFD